MTNFLSYSTKNLSGRNNSGRITLRHRGGGNSRKKHFSFVNYGTFSKSKYFSVLANRKSSLYALPIPNLSPLEFVRHYQFFRVRAYSNSDFPKIFQPNVYSRDFSLVPLHIVPVGQYVSNISDFRNYSIFARSYGSAAQLLRLRGSFATIRLPSGEIRKTFAGGMCVPTQVRKSFRRFKLYKAGQNRWIGHRPHVRGAAINPVDHPHGGRTGESRPSVSPWAILTKGFKTRSKPFNKKFVILSVRQFKTKKKLA